jgi:signal transduction histidine kinase
MSAVTPDALRLVPLFADLPDRTRTWLATVATPVHLDAGEVLLREGDRSTGLYVVLDGEVEIIKHVDDDALVAVSGPGALVGELSLVQSRPRTATVRAAVPTHLARFDPEVLGELVTDRRLALALLDTVGRRTQELEIQLRHRERMAQLGTLTAGLLHELNNPAAAIERSAAGLRELVTRWDAADAGLADAGLADPGLRTRLTRLVEQATPPAGALARLELEREHLAALRALGDDEAVAHAPALAHLGVAVSALREALDGLGPDATARAGRWLAERHRLDRVVDELSVASHRISEVVGAVKRFSHHDEAPVQEVDVHDGLEAALTILGGKVGHDVKIVRDYAGGLPHVEGYPADLNTVWVNLLDNALDAMEGSGTLTVRTSPIRGGVQVEVGNTGEEIPPEVLDRVFDPFFTTKPFGQGTGLGLAVSHAVVRRHRGRLRLASEPGRTVATVELPRHLHPPEA